MAHVKAKNARRPRFNSRPLYATLFLMTLLATYALFLGGPERRTLSSTDPQSIFLRARNIDIPDGVCDDVHEAKDQCAWVKTHCTEDEPGLLSYLGFYYCVLPKAKPVAFALLALWLGLMFSTIGIAASDFFSINLSTIASILGMPESLAGVTFLAFGNGSPDVFSTFAAMGSNSGSMAVGELIGAAGFISAVVAGSMALVREFRVSKKTFVRDIICFILAVTFTMLFLLDGKMHLWECSVMIGFYAFYVCFVVAWHWFSVRRKRRRRKEAMSRSHYSVASSHVGDDIEPYHDEVDEDEEEEDGAVGQRGRSEGRPDISALEAGPRFSLEGPSPDDEEDEDKERHVASEMTSSMRVNRPRGRRAHTTMVPIRPSLVGALEFRSILSSLTRARNMRLAPLRRGYSDHNSAGLLARSNTDPMEQYTDDPTTVAQSAPQSLYRQRALSSGAAPRHLPDPGDRYHHYMPVEAGQSRDGSRQRARAGSATQYSQHQESRSASAVAPMRKRDRLMSVARRALGEGRQRTRTPSPAVVSIRDGHLAPPGAHPRSLLSPELVAETPELSSSTPALSLRIPSPKLQPSQASSPSLSPFPHLRDSPMLGGGQQSPTRSHLTLATPQVKTYDHIPGLDPPNSPRPVRWWPYYALPPPHVLWRTLLPTLQGWREKTIWDKIFSIFSMPSVFLLVITLPVVETDSNEEEEQHVEDDHKSTYSVTGLGIHAPAIAVESHASLIQETEWQEYRRRAHSVRSRSSSASRHRLSFGPNDGFPFPEVTNYVGSIAEEEEEQQQHQQRQRHDNGSEHGVGSEPTTEDEPASWNRWLVVVQLFSGPLFTDFIVWSKYMDQPPKTLLMMILYSLVGSLVALALLLLFTTPDQKPKYHFLFCFLGFIISIAWISTIAEEVVGILKAVGVILGMSEAILGLTVFAVGNSVGDLVADITVARLGYPVMALSACFGGPMLNILLGIGLGGTYMTIKTAKHQHKKHPELPLHYGAYHIDVSGTLFISAIVVLTTLVMLLILVPSSKWMMTRRIGVTLITLWSVGTIVNVVVEVTGAWKAVAFV